MAKQCPAAVEAAVRDLLVRAETLRRTIGAVRRQEVEGIHDMRVASRRLRKALREYRRHFDPVALAQLNGMAREITRILGRPRELDVMIGQMEARRARARGGMRAAVDYALTELRARRAAVAESCAEAAAIAASGDFDKTLQALLNAPRTRKQCLLDTATQRLSRQYTGLYEQYCAWKKSRDEEHLHALRIAFKKMRYGCECYAPLYGPPMAAFLIRLKKTQTLLGDWNDSRMLRNELADILAQRPPEAVKAVEALIARIDAEARDIIAGFDIPAKGFFSKRGRNKAMALFASPKEPCCRD